MPLRVLVVYDSKHERGATRLIAECIVNSLRRKGVEAVLYRVTDPYPDPMGFDLVVIGAPIYYERPMETVTRFIDEHNGLPGSKIAVFITCLAASKKIPSPIRRIVVKKYLKHLTERLRGEIIALKAFKGWLRNPDPKTLSECVEWSEILAKTITSK